MKKTIVHIIDDLGRGGAETMLVNVVGQLTEYNNILVTLYPRNEFGDNLPFDEYHCLHLSSPLLIPFAAIKLRKLIEKKDVAFVHSHLFWSSLVARLGVPTKIPLITTIHSFVASSIEYKPWHMYLIEKWTYQIRKSIIVSVAKGSLEEYFSFMKVKPYKAYTLYTFVDTATFNESASIPAMHSDKIFRLIAVGNLKPQKNHAFLLDVFKHLREHNIILDIYGTGVSQSYLQNIIDKEQLPVVLKGRAYNIHQILKQYDLFVMPSLYEGFSISVLEAMAMSMPLLLTDMPSFTEQCADTAMYFKPNDEKDFIQKLLLLKNNTELLASLGNAAKHRVLDNFTLSHHLEKLRMIYKNALEEKDKKIEA